MINFSNRCYHACVRSALNCSRSLDSGSKGRQSEIGINRLKRCGVWCGRVCVHLHVYTDVYTPACTTPTCARAVACWWESVHQEGVCGPGVLAPRRGVVR